ncbi:hypothetical protein C8R44DRAFT_743056 [Mycena epipterygia]|nr:hypothetical protein C8R44DRAFT_743056 [Mycena epipterygia]
MFQFTFHLQVVEVPHPDFQDAERWVPRPSQLMAPSLCLGVALSLGRTLSAQDDSPGGKIGLHLKNGQHACTTTWFLRRAFSALDYSSGFQMGNWCETLSAWEGLCCILTTYVWFKYPGTNYAGVMVAVGEHDPELPGEKIARGFVARRRGTGRKRREFGIK